MHICQQIICPGYCTACSNDNFCTGCIASYYRTLNNGSCVCSSYSLDMSAVNVLTCMACYPTCETCASPLASTACLTCNLAKDHRTFLASNSTCNCVSGYYEIANLNTLYVNYLYVGAPCLACHYTCATCSASASCATCNASLNR